MSPLRHLAPWLAIAALVLTALLKFSTKTPAECVLITLIALAAGLITNRLATQFRGHILGSWDQGS